MLNNEKKITGRVLASVIAAGIMSFCGVLVETAMNITFPTLMDEFKVNTSTVQWMTTGCLLVVAIVVPLSAILKKNFPTKAIFLTSNLLFILGALLDALAKNFDLLLIGRMIQGVGTGLALPLMFNIILEQVPSNKIGLMMGIGSLITAVAPAIGPTYGGLIVNSLGWRFIFVLLIPILIVSLLMGTYSIKQVSAIKRTRVDLLGVLSIILMFTGFILGFSNLGENNIISLEVGGAWIVGILGLCLLLYRNNSSNPIINLDVLKNKPFAGHVISFFFFQLCGLGISFILPNYIQLVNHQTATIAGLIVLPGAALGAILAPISGQILDRMGARFPILLGTTFAVVALILFTIFSNDLSLGLIIVIYLLYMAGTGFAFGNIMTSGLQNLTLEQQADGNAILTTLQQFAGAMGTSVVAAIIAQSQNQTGISNSVATASGSHNAFIVLLVLGILEFLILFKVVSNKKTSN
ncbi:DHA2 family efflux MFS transporter permease subunit [Xylocopilactobacillus apis]|uniref:MFS transporter n=1 Tax=Xylocopilactobacillus apis TaxID=2932183 RepID=A0AAU9CZ99_9LACO|nr:DHA2 family efflux MFS transporter permease subunit [Xylocopilactobacillus apis]BDR56578.1 MFS transporter [Xylocopilactobacillus apis]